MDWKVMDWKVKVYVGNKVIDSWVIENRTEVEATREAEGDVDRIYMQLGDKEIDKADWTMTPIKSKMKLTREDIQKYGTEKEKLFLEAENEERWRPDEIFVVGLFDGRQIKKVLALLTNTPEGKKLYDKLEKRHKGEGFGQFPYPMRLNDISPFRG